MVAPFSMKPVRAPQPPMSQLPNAPVSHFLHVPASQHHNVEMSQCPSLQCSQCPSHPIFQYPNGQAADWVSPIGPPPAWALSDSFRMGFVFVRIWASANMGVRLGPYHEKNNNNKTHTHTHKTKSGAQFGPMAVYLKTC